MTEYFWSSVSMCSEQDGDLSGPYYVVNLQLCLLWLSLFNFRRIIVSLKGLKIMHRCKSSHWCSWFAKIHLQLLSVNAAPGESKSQFYSYCKFQIYMYLGLYNISLVLFGQNKTLPKKHTNEDDNCHRSVMKGHHCLCDFNNEKKPMNEIESWWLIEKSD